MAIGVNIKYYIPEDEYQYTKLTYKKDLIPESVNDGTIVNLDPTPDQQIVNDLEEGQVYYFIIYTDKSESPYVKYESPQDDPNTPFKEMIEIQKQVGEDEFRTVYSWFGKWGKSDEIEVNKYGVTKQQESITIMEGVTPMKYGKVQQQDNIVITEDKDPMKYGLVSQQDNIIFTDYKGSYDEVSVSASDTIIISEIVTQQTTTNEVASNIINFTEEASAEIVTEEE